MAITHDGLPKQGPLLSDGVRIYFVSGSMNHRSISQISVNGGEASTLVSALQSPRLMDISSNGSELLAASFGPDPGVSMGEKAGLNESALWSISLPSGNVRRIGDLFADAAAFAPDGQKIAIGWNNALYVVNSDGTDQRKIAQLPGTASSIRWSPDGKRLRIDDHGPEDPAVISLGGRSKMEHLCTKSSADGTRLRPSAAGDGVPMAAGTFSNLLAMAGRIYGRFLSLRA